MQKSSSKLRKNLKGGNRGITLIALVVTIIVLLILAGISIQMLTGNSGILTQTQNAKDSTRGGDVQEYVNLAVSENAIAEYTSGTKKTRDEVIGELYRDKKITENEYNKLMGLEGEEQVNVLTIGNVTIDFSVLGSINGLTIGSVYDDSMIGKKINYSSNGQSNWIIFGKDEKGNVLLTTEDAIENGFTLEGGADKWLTFEEDLKVACSGYGNDDLQGKKIESRSITMKDINRVTGFQEPTFKTYRFKDQANNDYANEIVNYYHPDASSDTKWSKAEKEYLCDAYYYRLDSDGTIKWLYEGTDWNEAECTQNLRNMNYVLKNGSGENATYVVASRSVSVNSSYAFFFVAAVYEGYVYSFDEGLCYSGSDDFYDYDYSVSVPVRPVVSLPSDIQVEEDSAVDCGYAIK